MDKIINFIRSKKIEWILIAILLTTSAVAHGYNMFHFPYYENDEGTYLAYAWSLLTRGTLSHYTYWYDHAPAGWMLLALWTKLTGGFFTFGVSVNSGRVLMLVLHVLSTLFLYLIAKNITKSKWVGVISAVIFSLSPLGIYFQRRVLLDNIMIFWILLSLFLVLHYKNKLRYVILSAITFGIAVLTKENAIYFFPAFVYTIHLKVHTKHKSFALVKWIAIAGLVVSLYFIYALIVGELFPSGTLLGGQNEHVSLLKTLSEQYSRGDYLAFWDEKSDFYFNYFEWIARDKFTIIAGSIATLLSIILSIKVKPFRIPVAFSVFFLLFLLRGKLVINFYIIPMLPLLALNIAGIINYIIKVTVKNRILYNITLAIITSGICFLLINNPLISNPIGLYSRDETTAQVKSITWIKDNVPSDSQIAIDGAIYIDLHSPRFQGDRIFPNADWAWKVEEDPAIRDTKLKKDWKKIEYITLSHEILKQIKNTHFRLLKKTLDNSTQVASWSAGSISYIDLKEYISTNGDWMSIYKTDDKNQIVLNESWKFYKANFIKSYGQIVDPANGNTTSEGQSYAMLRAVWMNDKPSFDGVWIWTKDHLRYRPKDKLLSWLWIKDKLGDPNTASDADEDIALALLFAHRQWGDKKYLAEARVMIDDIWKQEVVKVNGHYYLSSSANTDSKDGYLINPSYCSPATYRIFADIDPKHPWKTLASDCYYLLNKLGADPENKTYLPPNWIVINKETGTIGSPAKYIKDPNASNYGFDSFRTMWRVALDAEWFNDKNATSYLRKIEPFFAKQWGDNKQFFAIYNLSGENQVSYNSLSTSIAPLAVSTQLNNPMAVATYSKFFEKEFNFNTGYWKDKNNYYDQNWAWFGTALYAGKLPNLWIK